MNIFLFSIALAFVCLVPLSFKWELEAKITLPVILFIGILSGAIVHGVVRLVSLSLVQILMVNIVFILLIALLLLLWRFYRDPERSPVETTNVILSPADGRVVYIKRIKKGEIPISEKKGRQYLLDDFTQSNHFNERGYLIGIALTFLDVHINRAPMDGKVLALKHIPGFFLSLKKKDASVQNERALIVLENDSLRLGIVLIASRLVRKIVTYIKQGQNIGMGDRIGMIRLGSQVDVILPYLDSTRIEVNVGDKVKGGVSVLARFTQF